MWQFLFEALFKESQQLSNQRELARHLSRVALYELKGAEALYPDLKGKAERLMEIMAAQGMPIWIVEGFRTAKKQDDYYAKGRSKPGNVITNAQGLESYHQFGLAFDVAFTKYNWNPPKWEWWTALGKEGEKLGLVWGGSFQDWGHFEWHPYPGMEWKELKEYFQQRS